jgi:ADP-heptose:LPS heptosyltransferase
MSVGISDEDKSWAREWISRNNLLSFPVIAGVAPCGGDSFGPNAYIKRWPAENYALLIKRLRQAYNAAILVFAGPKESGEVKAIIGDSGETAGIFDLSGATLGQTIALLDHCSLFIGNDTGAMRFADALGKKLIAFFGPQDEVVYGPYPFDKSRTVVLKKELSCRPCYKRFRLSQCTRDRECLRSLTVDDAFEAAKALLGNRA